MKSLTAWFYSVFTAALILGISVIGLQAPRPMIDVRTIPLITHQGGLTPLHPTGEIFNCTQDGLRRIDVILTAIGPSLRAHVTPKLRANSPEGVVLREVRVKPELTHNTPSWASFEFEPVADSRGKTFHFSVEPADEAATSLSPWVRYHGQLGRNDPWGDRYLPADVTHEAEFVSAHANLRALAFPVESMFPSLGTTRLAIFDDPNSKEPIRSSTLSLQDETHLGWAFFSFEPIPESRWKRYYFELDAPEHCRLIGTEDESHRPIPVFKTFHGLELMNSSLRGMTRGTLRQPDRDLVFRAWCEDPPSGVLARLEDRTGGDLWLAAILWCIATAICLRLFVFKDASPTSEVDAPSEEELVPDAAAAD